MSNPGSAVPWVSDLPTSWRTRGLRGPLHRVPARLRRDKAIRQSKYLTKVEHYCDSVFIMFNWNTFRSPLHSFSLWKSRLLAKSNMVRGSPPSCILVPTQCSAHGWAHGSCGRQMPYRFCRSPWFWTANVPLTIGKPGNNVSTMWKLFATGFSLASECFQPRKGARTQIWRRRAGRGPQPLHTEQEFCSPRGHHTPVRRASPAWFLRLLCTFPSPAPPTHLPLPLKKIKSYGSCWFYSFIRGFTFFF